MKHNIFTTYSASPTKNIKTPIRRFNGESAEEEVVVNETTMEIAPLETQIMLLEHIRTLLVVMIIIIIICLIAKK